MSMVDLLDFSHPFGQNKYFNPISKKTKYSIQTSNFLPAGDMSGEKKRRSALGSNPTFRLQSPLLWEIPDHATFRGKGGNTGLVRQAWGFPSL